MSFKEKIKSYGRKIKKTFDRIRDFVHNHNFLFKAVKFVCGICIGFIGAKILHNRKSVDSVGDNIQSATNTVDRARELNQAAESNVAESERINDRARENVEQLESTVASGQSILEAIRKQKIVEDNTD